MGKMKRLHREAVKAGTEKPFINKYDPTPVKEVKEPDLPPYVRLRLGVAGFEEETRYVVMVQGVGVIMTREELEKYGKELAENGYRQRTNNGHIGDAPVLQVGKSDTMAEGISKRERIVVV